MNKIDQTFKNNNKPLLSIYVTAGYPEIDSLLSILPALEESGVDMVEIGMPFSDPLADGPVIQKSSQIALDNGMNLEVLFNQLASLNFNIPIILMGYLNPVWQYGIERFLQRCNECGVSGTIIPDLPLSEYLKFKLLFEENQIYNILLATPQTSDERIRILAQETKGFLYAVSSASTTGTKEFSESDPAFFERLKNHITDTQIMIGFGIKNRSDFIKAGELADGAIIGSQFIITLSEIYSSNRMLEYESITKFVKEIRN